jgi:predicted porin
MKKIALTALLVGLMGMAQADVSVYGKFREYEESYTLGSASAVTRLTNDTSRFGIKASENVGNGITVSGVIETGVAVDAPSATTLGDRVAVVSLSNNLGTLGLGRDKHAVTRALDNFDALENTYGTIAGTIHAAQGSRVQNAVFVTSAPIMGVSATYQLANSETAGVSNAQAGSINYSAGALSATVARYDDSISSASTIAGVKYNLAKTGTTVFGLYSDDKVSSVSTTGKSIGVAQVVAPKLTALASYGENSNGTKAYAVGAAYAQNKSLTFHARYSMIDTVTDVTQYGVGVEYNF